MARRYLEITAETKNRLGFYADLPPNPMDFTADIWHLKEDDIIQGIRDPDSGTLKGPIVVTLRNDAKGENEIDAQDWEIGTKIVKILLPEGETVTVDLRKGPLRLAELEISGEQANDKPKEIKDKPTEVSGEKPKLPQPQEIKITPLARTIAIELGVKLDDVIASLPVGTPKVTVEHVKQYAERIKSQPAATPDIQAAPAARRRAKELNIDLATIKGTGPDGLIKLEDVEEAARLEPTPSVVNIPTVWKEEPEFDVIKPTALHKITARHMDEAHKIPDVGPEIDINPAPLLELRERMKEDFGKIHGIKLRLDHFFIAAVAWLLAQDEFKILNAYWYDSDGKPEIRVYRHANVAMAISIPAEKVGGKISGLAIPSVKRAEMLTFVQIAKEAERIIADTADGKLNPADQMGATFIVNNVGAPVEWRGKKLAGDEFPNPILAPGLTAEVAFGTPRDESGRKRMRLAMRFDHRVVNGKEPITFLRVLQNLLENPELILSLK